MGFVCLFLANTIYHNFYNFVLQDIVHTSICSKLRLCLKSDIHNPGTFLQVSIRYKNLNCGICTVSWCMSIISPHLSMFVIAGLLVKDFVILDTPMQFCIWDTSDYGLLLAISLQHLLMLDIGELGWDWQELFLFSVFAQLWSTDHRTYSSQNQWKAGGEVGRKLHNISCNPCTMSMIYHFFMSEHGSRFFWQTANPMSKNVEGTKEVEQNVWDKTRGTSKVLPSSFLYISSIPSTYLLGYLWTCIDMQVSIWIRLMIFMLVEFLLWIVL